MVARTPQVCWFISTVGVSHSLCECVHSMCWLGVCECVNERMRQRVSEWGWCSPTHCASSNNLSATILNISSIRFWGNWNCLTIPHEATDWGTYLEEVDYHDMQIYLKNGCLWQELRVVKKFTSNIFFFAKIVSSFWKSVNGSQSIHQDEKVLLATWIRRVRGSVPEKFLLSQSVRQ